MHRAARLAVLLCIGLPICHVAAGQAPRQPLIPHALAVHLKADADRSTDLADLSVEEIRGAVKVERRDVNGDGVPELFVEGSRFCGTNCERWIYRTVRGGSYELLFHDFGTGETVLADRAHGWPSLTEYSHMSCCEGGTHLYVFDGRRYTWRSSVESARRMTGGGADSVIYRVALVPERAERPRSLVMDPVSAEGGLWVAARYDVCRAGVASCAPAVLRLWSARLPAGRVCVEVRSRNVHAPSRPPPPDPVWCGVTVQAHGSHGEAGRILELRPVRRDWSALRFADTLEMRGPGMPGELSIDARAALDVFVMHLAEIHPLSPRTPAGR